MTSGHGRHAARRRRGRRQRFLRAISKTLLMLPIGTAAVLVDPAPFYGGRVPMLEADLVPASPIAGASIGVDAAMERQHLVASRARGRHFAARLPFVPTRGSGDLTFISLPQPKTTTGKIVTYTLEIEEGLPVVSREVAQTVARVLADRRGWRTAARVRFVPVSARAAKAGTTVDIRITLASPAMADRLCAPLATEGELSCWQRGRAVLNARRWVGGAPTYGPDIAAYRIYLINHEVGHGLGRGHVRCPDSGRRAPVMVQQTKALDRCTPWPWPTGTAT